MTAVKVMMTMWCVSSTDSTKEVSKKKPAMEASEERSKHVMKMPSKTMREPHREGFEMVLTVLRRTELLETVQHLSFSRDFVSVCLAEACQT
jgi:hypothetical protein